MLGVGRAWEVSGQELPAPCPLQEEQTSCPDTHQAGLGSLGWLPGDKGQPAARNRILCVLWENVGIEVSAPPGQRLKEAAWNWMFIPTRCLCNTRLPRAPGD